MPDLKVPVSLFSSYRNPVPDRQVMLFDFLTKTSPKLSAGVELIRSETDKKLRDDAKAKLPAVTPSGIFSYRRLSSQVSHSGLICIDLDGVSDVNEAKARLSILPYVSYIGKSVSGTGLFFIAGISNPELHGEHFDWIKRDVFEKFGYNIDKSCRDASRLRGYSIDPDYYYNPSACIIHDTYKEPEREMKPSSRYPSDSDEKRFFQLLDMIENTGIDMTSDRGNWIRIGTGIASKFGDAGYDYFLAMSRNYPGFNEAECRKQWKSFLRAPKCIGLGTIFFIAKRHGLILNEK